MESGNAAATRALLAAGADRHRIPALRDGKTLLMLAAGFGETAVVEELLAPGSGGALATHLQDVHATDHVSGGGSLGDRRAQS